METNQSSGVMGLLKQKMLYDAQKSALHAQNVAHSDTPGYKARDISPFTFGEAMQKASSGISVTDPRHIVPASMAGVNAKTFNTKTSEALPSGNTVNLEHEMMEVSKTGVDYQAVTLMYKKLSGFFRIALRGQ